MEAVAVFPDTRRVDLVDEDVPSLAALTHVRLRMLDVGVCGTDREICAFQYGTPRAEDSHGGLPVCSSPTPAVAGRRTAAIHASGTIRTGGTS